MTLRNCAVRIAVTLGGLLAASGSLSAFQAQTSGFPTPIKYVVVIFDENNSFDHYFGTYPHAANPQGQPAFEAAAGTPAINGLSGGLMTLNPNGVQPFRLDRTQNVTCDNDNHYLDEQKATNGGLLNKYAAITSAAGSGCTPNLSMGYYDGNTLTALWNYAQRFAMGDNFFATTFGTTVMGHLNLVSGQTHQNTTQTIAGKVVNGSVIANLDAVGEDCVDTSTTVQMTGKNIGDLLNTKGVTWGWFYGDWTPVTTVNGKAQCTSIYDDHYAPFQYYASTVNPHHLPPTSVAMIGQTDQANHQYALTDFWNAAKAGTIPSVTFLKPSATETGHPSTSDPLSEQAFLVNTINQLQQLPQWKEMAVFITYDDSDGWYDHVMPPVVNQSNDSANDGLLGAGMCGTPQSGAYLDRCGYGPRLPFLVISPYAKQNFVDHSLMDQTSILRFIEDNWSLGRIGDQSFDEIAGSVLGSFDFSKAHSKPLILDPGSGELVRK
jgi:phospholipase C